MNLNFRLSLKTLLLGAFSLSMSITSYAQNNILVDDYGMEAQNKFLGTSAFDTSNIFHNQTIPDFTYPQTKVEFDTIVNVGKIIWDVIKGGKPVVNIKTDVANALPEGIPNWNALSQWKKPVAKNFEFTWTLLGMEVIKFDYALVFTPGGKWDGRGAYLTNVMVVPTNVGVSWGYSLNSTVEVMQVVNIGTQHHPIAALELRLNLSFDSYLFHNERNVVFYMTGDGYFEQMAFY